MPEMLDTYDANLVPLIPVDRERVHSEGLWHRTFHCWVVAKRDNRTFVLLQLRAPDKRMFPDMLDITAAGHLESGESTSDGVRELNEELGVDRTVDDLIYLGIKHDVADVGDTTRNREFADVYLMQDDRRLEAYDLQEAEVSGLAEIEVQDGLRLFSGEAESVNATATRIENGKAIVFSRPIRREDLIPRVDSYYYKIFIMTERYFAGSHYLAI